MKRFLVILLVVLLIMSNSIVFGNVADKLKDHWANNIIDKTFLAYYFPYLARDNFAKFDPNGYISEQDFAISLASLFKDNDYIISGVGKAANITRSEMVNNLGAKLLEIGLTNKENYEIPFKDVNTMPDNSIELLRILYNNGIISGDSDTNFSPNRYLSQAEAIIILQRVKEVLENMNTVAFNTMGIVQTFNNQEEIIVKTNEDKVLVTITKEFPNPGYSMSVSKIQRESGGYRIYFQITPPRSDSMQLQVITYKTLTIEIDRDLMDPPYNFILDGFNKTPISRA